MGKVIGIMNQKGGVGKTTVSIGLAEGFQKFKGKKTLLIDLDAQHNASFILRASNEPNVIEMLKGEIAPADAIQKGSLTDVIAGSDEMRDAINEIPGRSVVRLRDCIDEVRDLYDVIILETPPGFGIVTLSALIACDEVIIPSEASIVSIQGITQIIGTIETKAKILNPEIRIRGILINRYKARLNVSKVILNQAEKIADQLGTVVFETKIRDSKWIAEAQALRQSIFEYAPRSPIALDFGGLIDELID